METTVASTELITIGENCVTPKSPRMTSSANSAPATGALKVAAIPAAAPHPTNVFRFLGGIFNNCPMVEPIDEPICTIGPSRPTDPPVPIVAIPANNYTIIQIPIGIIPNMNK